MWLHHWKRKLTCYSGNNYFQYYFTWHKAHISGQLTFMASWTVTLWLLIKDVSRSAIQHSRFQVLQHGTQAGSPFFSFTACWAKRWHTRNAQFQNKDVGISWVSQTDTLLLLVTEVLYAQRMSHWQRSTSNCNKNPKDLQKVNHSQQVLKDHEEEEISILQEINLVDFSEKNNNNFSMGQFSWKWWGMPFVPWMRMGWTGG